MFYTNRLNAITNADFGFGESKSMLVTYAGDFVGDPYQIFMIVGNSHQHYIQSVNFTASICSFVLGTVTIFGVRISDQGQKIIENFLILLCSWKIFKLKRFKLESLKLVWSILSWKIVCNWKAQKWNKKQRPKLERKLQMTSIFQFQTFFSN